MLSLHLHFKHFLGAAQHFRRPENNREELQFQTSQASFHQELCSFVLVRDAAAECFGVQSWCWLLGQSLGAWDLPLPRNPDMTPCSHYPVAANGHGIIILASHLSSR